MGPQFLRHMTEQGTEMDTPNLTEVNSFVSMEVYVKIGKHIIVPTFFFFIFSSSSTT